MVARLFANADLGRLASILVRRNRVYPLRVSGGGDGVRRRGRILTRGVSVGSASCLLLLLLPQPKATKDSANTVVTASFLIIALSPGLVLY